MDLDEVPTTQLFCGQIRTLRFRVAETPPVHSTTAQAEADIVSCSAVCHKSVHLNDMKHEVIQISIGKYNK
jgi:hypothetical protein